MAVDNGVRDAIVREIVQRAISGGGANVIGSNLMGMPLEYYDPKDHSPTASFGSTPDFQGGLPSARDAFDLDRTAGWGWGAEDNLSDPTMSGGAPTPTPADFDKSFSSTAPTFAPFASYDDSAVPAPPGDFVTTAPLPEFSPHTPSFMPEFNPDTNPPGGFPTAPSEQNTGLPTGWGGVDFASLGGMGGLGGLGGVGATSGVDFGQGGSDYGGSSESGSSGVG